MKFKKIKAVVTLPAVIDPFLMVNIEMLPILIQFSISTDSPWKTERQSWQIWQTSEFTFARIEYYWELW